MGNLTDDGGEGDEVALVEAESMDLPHPKQRGNDHPQVAYGVPCKRKIPISPQDKVFFNSNQISQTHRTLQ